MCVLTKKKKKHIEQNFHFVAGVMPQGWDLGVLVVKNLSVGICDGAPSTAQSNCEYIQYKILPLFNLVNCWCINYSLQEY